ncbi:InlB B-repeat-containing protein [Desulfopila inferna]|uniref:InlB B-repeat-containing protein n=1 Tax=Desulfopila inferna TaxID=468528 RepID=UPI00196690F7
MKIVLKIISIQVRSQRKESNHGDFMNFLSQFSIAKIYQLISAIIFPFILAVPYSQSATIDVSTANYGDIIYVSNNDTLTGTTTKQIEIRCTSSCNVTLDNLNVDLQANNIWDVCALEFYSSTNNTITLVGTNVIKSGVNEPGIKVPSSATLTIKGSGSLHAVGAHDGAGIGSGNGLAAGTIIIHSGTVRAEGQHWGAGIGGGRQASSQRIEISGGSVTATSHTGAAIGGGGADDTDFIVGSGGTINISGGTVQAYTAYGAGIGSGGNRSSSNVMSSGLGPSITISGGTVTARSSLGGAGIGTGWDAPNGGQINISGGIVHATSSLDGLYLPDEFAAGIGGGYKSSFSSVNITGGEVYAARSKGYNNNSYDIGGGQNGTVYNNVSISGTSAVFLKDDRCEKLSTSHTHVNYQSVSSNTAYGYANFPDDWNDNTAYGYVVRYAVSFNGNGSDGGNLPSTRYYYLSDPDRKIPEPTAPNVPSRTGYALNGWCTIRTCAGIEWDFATDQANSSLTLYANWTTNNYSITYHNAYGGTSLTPTSYTIEDTPFSLPVLSGRTGYTFVGWYDNSELAGNTYSTIPAGSTGDKEFWEKWIPNYSLTYSAETGGSINGDESQTVDHGADGTTVTAVPTTGYHFIRWSDGSTENPRTDTNITADLVISASFAINTYCLTYEAGEGGAISGNTSQTINYGTDGSVVVAAPVTGYHFVQWSDGSTENPRTDTDVTTDLYISANFAINTYSLSVLFQGNGTGTVTSEPVGIDCGDDCQEILPHNTEVTLTAASHVKSDFKGWYGACSGIDNTCVITIDQILSVGARFEKKFPWGILLPGLSHQYKRIRND